MKRKILGGIAKLFYRSTSEAVIRAVKCLVLTTLVDQRRKGAIQQKPFKSKYWTDSPPRDLGCKVNWFHLAEIFLRVKIVVLRVESRHSGGVVHDE